MQIIPKGGIIGIRKFFSIFTVAVALASAGEVLAAEGAVIFALKCASCHGKDAKGSPMAPQLAGSEFINGPEDPIKQAISNGRSGDAKKYKQFPLPMPKLGLKDDEIDAVVKYLKSLK